MKDKEKHLVLHTHLKRILRVFLIKIKIKRLLIHFVFQEHHLIQLHHKEGRMQMRERIFRMSKYCTINPIDLLLIIKKLYSKEKMLSRIVIILMLKFQTHRKFSGWVLKIHIYNLRRLKFVINLGQEWLQNLRQKLHIILVLNSARQRGSAILIMLLRLVAMENKILKKMSKQRMLLPCVLE